MKFPSIPWTRFEVKPGIGYVKLSGFNEKTDTELAAALKQLDATNLEGLVLDLRGNPGGLLNEAVAVSDMFLDKNQLIVSHHGRASQERRYYAVRGNRGVTVPLVVIVNGGSASASEIVTGAIQDHDRGLVVGEQSFGKGLVQTVSGLSENTGLALTTARYYTPSGRLIQRDYKDISLYDYLYNHKNPPPTEVKLTDSGRQVSGGGGITPDVLVEPAKLNPFQEMLLRRDVFFAYQGGVGSFTTYFLGIEARSHQGIRGRRCRDEDIHARTSTRKRSHTPMPISRENLAWIKREIKKGSLHFRVRAYRGRTRSISKTTRNFRRRSSPCRRRARSTRTPAKLSRSARTGTRHCSGSNISRSHSTSHFSVGCIWIPRRALLKSHGLSGRLAQLGERIVRNDEAGGSNPPPSTKIFAPLPRIPSPPTAKNRSRVTL